MPFGEQKWDIVLPDNLRAVDKERLKRLLSQFFDPVHRLGEKKYDNFYHLAPPGYFLQGDLIHSIKFADWDYGSETYSTDYMPVVLLSNTCDISPANEPWLEKQALYAPVVSVEDFFNTLKKEFGFHDAKIKIVHGNLKNQVYSNIFYLPPNPVNKKEFIVFLDNIFWQPSSVLKAKIKTISSERFISLNHFGFYLLITKLSYHFCRVPEEIDR
jgi:hypothetical protein